MMAKTKKRNCGITITKGKAIVWNKEVKGIVENYYCEILKERGELKAGQGKTNVQL